MGLERNNMGVFQDFIPEGGTLRSEGNGFADFVAEKSEVIEFTKEDLSDVDKALHPAIAKKKTPAKPKEAEVINQEPTN